MTNLELIQEKIKSFSGQFMSAEFDIPQNGKLAMTKGAEADLKTLHKLQPNIQILLAYYKKNNKPGGYIASEMNFEYSLVCLPKGVSFILRKEIVGKVFASDIQETLLYLKWKDIDEAESKDFKLDFLKKNSNEKSNFTFKDVDDEIGGILLPDIEVIVNLINKISLEYIDEKQKEYESIKSLIESQEWKSVIDKCEQFESEHGESNGFSPLVTIAKVKSLLQINEVQKALIETNNALQDKYFKGFHNDEAIKEKLSDSYSNFIFLKGQIFEKQNLLYEAMHQYNVAASYSKISKDKKEITERLLDTYKSYISNFPKLPFENRKSIFIFNELNNLGSESFKVLLKNQLPKIAFAPGHPQENTLYVAHPYQIGFYIPFASHESFLFRARLDEFTYLMQCLGAKSLTINFMQGKKLDAIYDSTKDLNVNADGITQGGNVDLKVDMKSENKNENKKENENGLSITQTFQATNKKPFLPEGLVFFPFENTWQNLAKQRLNASILNHSETISSKEISNTFSHNYNQIKADLKSMMFNAGGNYEAKIEETINKEEETTTWTINVEFNEVDFSQVENIVIDITEKTLSQNELDYIDEVKFLFIDDRIIDEDEKRVLERKRTKLGISPERANELELIATDMSLSSEEKEYLEEYKFLLNENPNLGEKEQRILERLQTKLGISKERAKELQEEVDIHTLGYSDNELKYIDEIKFCLEDDGEISSSERRLLNKERDKLGISENRALEIESEFIKMSIK